MDQICSHPNKQVLQIYTQYISIPKSENPVIMGDKFVTIRK